MTRMTLAAAVVAISIGAWTIDGHAQQAAQVPNGIQGITLSPPNTIQQISICGGGSVPSPGCPAGTSDTQQVVLAKRPKGAPPMVLNAGKLPNAVDEHSSIFPPHSLGINPGSTDSEYVFFVASGTKPDASLSSTIVHLSAEIGAVVLSGKADANGQWHLGFASGFGSIYNSADTGAVFLAPMGQERCPPLGTSDNTFDLNYAAPGSVVADPLGPPGSLLMVYEGTNECPATTPETPRIKLGIATSADYGHTWPAYAPKPPNPKTGYPGYAYPPLPYQNTQQGPNMPDTGTIGKAVCSDHLDTLTPTCAVTTPYPGYGRYPVLTPPPGGASPRDAQPAAFVDNVLSGSPIYLYTVQDYNPNQPLPDGRAFDITIARAELNGGTAPLAFEKWNGQSCDPSSPPCWVGSPSGHTLNDAVEYRFLADGAYSACGDPALQTRTSPSISYFAATQQYVLAFVCTSPGDPASPAPGNPADATLGAAWFFSTSYDLADPNSWSTPKEIIGSWNRFSYADFYNGWYPTFMSLNQDPAKLTDHGYAFYLWGREGGVCSAALPCGGRQFSSRRFAIQTTDNVYSTAPVTTVVGTANVLTGDGVFTFRSNEPGSAFECAFNGGVFTTCQSPATYILSVGTNTLSVRATNPFGMVGPVATARVLYHPPPIKQ